MTVECGVRKDGVWTFWVCDVNENKFWTPEKVEGRMSVLRAINPDRTIGNVWGAENRPTQGWRKDASLLSPEQYMCVLVGRNRKASLKNVEQKLAETRMVPDGGNQERRFVFSLQKYFLSNRQKWGQKHQYCTNLGWKMLWNLASWMVNCDSWIVKLWSG